MRFFSNRVARAFRQALSAICVAFGMLSFSGGALAAEQVLFIDIHDPNGSNDLIGNFGLVISNPGADGKITGIYLNNSQNVYLYPYNLNKPGGGTNATGLNTSNPLNLLNTTYQNVGGNPVPIVCAGSGNGTCWYGATADAPMANNNMGRSTTSLGTVSATNYGMGFTDWGTYTYTSSGPKPGYTITALNFGFTDSNGSSWWIEGSGSGPSASYDLHAAYIDSVTGQYVRSGAANQNLINNVKWACTETQVVGGPCPALTTVPEIDGKSLPKAVLLIASILLVAGARRRAAI